MNINIPDIKEINKETEINRQRIMDECIEKACKCITSIIEYNATLEKPALVMM